MYDPSIPGLLKEAKRYYRKHKRSHLPWRKTHDPYKIMVSEVMLQQTQVDRVLPHYRAFIKRFSNMETLAKADLSDVLAVWQGLGYNRRGKMLRDAARIVHTQYNGKFPKDLESIESLPGIGPYTARAIAAFAYNQPMVLIETNIRTVFFYHLYVGHTMSYIEDAELKPLVAKALERSRMEPREFYAMLMDYGSFLKKSGVRLNTRSKHYTKQSRFEGSRRQLRGQLLKLMLEKPQRQSSLIYQTGRLETEVADVLDRLVRERLIYLKNAKFYVAK